MCQAPCQALEEEKESEVFHTGAYTISMKRLTHLQKGLQGE